MATATTADAGFATLTAQLAENNSDETKGREWSRKMMQKGDTKAILWARRTAQATEGIYTLLKAWAADMAAESAKMAEALAEAGRGKPKKPDGEGGGGTVFTSKNLGLVGLGIFGALAAWGTELGTALQGLFAVHMIPTIQKLVKWIKLTFDFGKITTLIGESKAWGAITKFFAPVGTFFKSIGGILKPIGVIIDPIIAGFKVTKGWLSSVFGAIGKMFAVFPKIWTLVSPALGFLKAVPVIGWVIAAIMGVFDGINGFIEGWSSEDGSFIDKLIAGVWGAIEAIFHGFVTKPLDLLKDGVAWIMGKLGWDSAQKWLKSFSFEQMFRDVFAWIGTTLKGVGEFFGKLFTDPGAAVMMLIPDWMWDFAGWLYDKAIAPIVKWFGTLFSDPMKAIKELWTAYLNIGKWIYDTAIKPIIEWFGTLFTDPAKAIKELWTKYVAIYTDFGKWIYTKAIKPVIDWFGTKLFGTDDASGAVETFFKDKFDAITNFVENAYKKYLKPVVDWIGKLFGMGDAAEGGGEKSFFGKKLDQIFAFGDLVYDKFIKPVVDWVKKIFGGGEKAEDPSKGLEMPSWDDIKQFGAKYLKKLLRLILPDPGHWLGKWVSKAIPDNVYEFAGVDPKTGKVTEVEPTAGDSALAGEKVAANAAAMSEHVGALHAAGAGGGSVNLADNSDHSVRSVQSIVSVKQASAAKLLEAQKRIANTQVD